MPSHCRVRAEALDAYLHGMLNDAQQREIESHLVLCDECNRALKDMESETYAIGVALRAVDVPPLKISAAELIEKHAVDVHRNTTTATAAQLSAATLPLLTALRALPLRPLLRAAAIFFAVGLSLAFIVGTVYNLKGLREKLATETARAEKWNQEQVDKLNTLRAEQTSALEMRYKLLQNEMTMAIEKERVLHKLQLVAEEEKRGRMDAELRTQITEDREKHAEQKREWEKTEARLTAEREQLRRELQDLNHRLNHARTELAQLKKKTIESPALQLTNDPALTIGYDNPSNVLETKPIKLNGNTLGWVARVNSEPAARPMNQPNIRVEQLAQIFSKAASYAAPVAANGRVIVGDGYRGKMLYAFDTKNGSKAWTLEAKDTGLGTPVLSEDGQLVSFTSQSCTIYALETKTGRQLWNKYLAARVETHPAVSGNFVYVVHPNENHVRTTGNGAYALTCMELRTGRVKWSVGIESEIHSSPVVSGPNVYVAMRNGMMAAFKAEQGAKLWSAYNNASCAPVERDGRLFYTQWAPDKNYGFTESLSAIGAADGSLQPVDKVTPPFPASYLVPVSITAELIKRVDDYSHNASEFENVLLKETLASNPVHTPTFYASWNYNGPRPTIVGREGYAAVGDRIVCADVNTGNLLWSHRVVGEGEAYILGRGQPPLTPPAVVGGKLYFGSVWGDVLCMDAQSGRMNWRYRLPNAQGVTSEIILDNGKAYAVSDAGLLYCLDTGNPDASGWSMAGGSPSRNAMARKF